MSKSFIDIYVETMCQRTGAIKDFHQLVAICAISSVLSRKTFLEFEHGDCHPNIWGILIGESSVTYKTTSINFLRDKNILPNKKDMPSGTASGVYIGPDDCTPEGLIDDLSEHPSMFIIRDELSRYWEDIATKKYQTGSDTLYADLFTCPSERKKKLSGNKITLKNIYLVILGGTTPEGLKVLSERHIRTGYLPRHLFVVSEEGDLPPIINRRSKTQKNADKELKSLLGDIHYVYWETPKIGISNSALSEYGLWDRELHIKMRNEPEKMMRYFLSRASAYVGKLAIIFMAARFSHTVEEEDIEMAIDYMENRLEDAHKVIEIVEAKEMSSKHSTVFDKIMERIRKHSPMSRRDLTQSLNRFSPKELDQGILHASQAEMITISYGKRGGPIYTITKRGKKIVEKH